MGAHERSRVLLRIADGIDAHAAELAELAVLEVGVTQMFAEIIAAAFWGIPQLVQCMPTRRVLSSGRETVPGSGCGPSRGRDEPPPIAFPSASTSENFTCAPPSRTFKG